MVIRKVLLLDAYHITGFITNNRYLLTVNIPKYSGKFLVHRSMLAEQMNSRQKTASTKTRSEVRGGGRKPWKQKGTGRARAGSIRSPLWTGGGVTFGPKPNVASFKINKKERILAFQALIYNKRKDIILIQDLETSSLQSNTKIFLNFCKNWSLNFNQKTLIIISKVIIPLKLSVRNLRNIETVLASNLNIITLLNTKHVIITPEAVSILKETFYG